MTQIQLTDYILYLCLDGRMVEVKTKLPITLYNRQNDEFLLIPQEGERCADLSFQLTNERFKTIVAQASKSPSKSRDYYGYDVNGKDSYLYSYKEDVPRLIMGNHFDVASYPLPRTCTYQEMRDCLNIDKLAPLEAKLNECMVKELWRDLRNLVNYRINPIVLRQLMAVLTSKIPHVNEHFVRLVKIETFHTHCAPKALDLVGFLVNKLENKFKKHIEDRKKSLMKEAQIVEKNMSIADEQLSAKE